MAMRVILAAWLAALAAFGSPGSAHVLPNGWKVTPSGAITQLGTLPLRMALDGSGKWIAVTNAGYGPLSVSVVNAASGRVVDTKKLDNTFYGVAFSPDGRKLYVSTASQSGIRRFAFDRSNGSLRDLGAWKLAPGNVWTAGIAVSPDGRVVYAAGNLADTLYAVDSRDGSIAWQSKTGSKPYAVAVTPDGRRVFVSDWGGASLTVLDARTGAREATIHVAAHPNALAMAQDGKTLFVACANGDTVEAIDVAGATIRYSIDAGLWPNAPEGTTPNGLALSRDGRTLYVADAGDNAVVAVDLASKKVTGAIPVGWYVTDVAVAPDGKSMYALDGDGLSGHPNPLYQHSAVATVEDDRYYVGSRLTGDLERISVPVQTALATGLKTARENSLYSKTAQAAQPAPATVKHVIYVIKENRTYDEVLGDDSRGNGDAALAIFGRRITPNIHRIADDFVLLDNFEEDGFVSGDGHNWATSAYATDYVEKLWPADYAGRSRPYDFQGGAPSIPTAGYLWDDAIAHGHSVRDYGEFINPGSPKTPEVASLSGHFDPQYEGWNLKYSDQRRLDEWQREFAAFERDGRLPDLEIVYLPDDHTGATSPGYRTPYAMLASNDYAVGRLIDRVSHSRYWKDTVVFVTEDDAQAGPDHVSDQRAEALVAGGPVVRGVVDHTLYTQCSVLKTIEIVLRLPPMSQFDAGATPMTPLFAARPDVRPWTASRPNVDLRAVNGPRAKGAQASLQLNLDEADASDAAAFNRILFSYAAHAATPRRSSPGEAPRER
jgi:YVTN family beta-propeller protein